MALHLLALLATKPYHHDGLRQLAALLPTDDAELHKWLSAAGEAMDETTFKMLFSAAAMAGRKLQASLLTAAMLLQESPWNVAWVAWRMEGNVTEELLRGLEAVAIVTNEGRALALFVAAAWWLEHRKGEEPPRQIMHLANELSERQNIDPRTVIILQDLAILLGGAEFAQARARAKMPSSPSAQRKQLDKAFALLNGPYERFIYERRTHQYSGNLPQRRAVEHIGRNEKCPCGSGKKYKHCCYAKDRERLRRSSSVPGMTGDELSDNPGAALTEARLVAMGPTEILQLEPDQVPKELQEKFILKLMILKQYDAAIAVFRKLGVPDHLRHVWSRCSSMRPSRGVRTSREI